MSSMRAARASSAPTAAPMTAPRKAVRGRKSRAENTSVVSTFSLPTPPSRYFRALPSQEISSRRRPIADGGVCGPVVTPATVVNAATPGACCVAGLPAGDGP